MVGFKAPSTLSNGIYLDIHYLCTWQINYNPSYSTQECIAMMKVKIVILGLIPVFISSSLFLVASAYPEEERSISERIVEILKERGILKEEEYEELKQLAEKEKEEKATTPKVTFKRGFAIETPDENFKLRLSGRLHTDFKSYGSSHPGNSTFYVRRARFCVEGTLYKYFDFKVESEFGKGTSGRLNDGYLNVRYFHQFQLKMGQYKQPFSLEELTPDNWIDFVERSLANNLVPSRDVGVMLHGDLFQEVINYGIGLCNGYRINQSQDTDDHKDVVGRLIFSPFLRLNNRFLKGFHVGGSFTYGKQESDEDEWWNKGEFKTAAGTQFLEFDDDVLHDGTRRRYGTELSWFLGPFSIKGEWMTLRMDDLWSEGQKEDFRADAGYISLSYFLTGEHQPFKKGVVQRVIPKKHFDPHKKTWGAWQLVARYSFLDTERNIFKEGFADSKRYTDRAEAYTLGVNWYLNDMVRMMFNYVRTEFDEDILYRNERIDSEDVFLGRFQLVW